MNTEPVQHEPENLFRRNAIAPPAHRRGHTVTLRRALLTVGALLCVAISACGKLTEVPTYPPVSQYTWLPQNWSQGQRDWYHHADQGTSLGVPLEWFLALEQPSYSLTQAAPLSDPNYMDRFGFISYGNPPGAPPVPVGFAAGRTPLKADGSAWLNPATGKSMTGMGLTCAACHTGRMTWRGTEILIDGAPALTNVMTFRTVLGESLWFTLNWPFRFDRFANRVLGPGAGDQAKAALRADLGLAVKQVEQEGKLEDSVRSQGTTEGFARLDALNRIGNTVFALDQKKLENYVGTSAPVHYPHIWNASWFTWVQYNGSIEQPMVRNAGEALGVGAPVNLIDPKAKLFASGVRVDELYKMEQLLAGARPNAKYGFSGLASPKWPSGTLPPIDQPLAARGAVLYHDMCQGCHLPPVTTPAFWTSGRWTKPNAAGERYLDLKMIDISEVGTDPGQAVGTKNRTVTIPNDPRITSTQFGLALGQVVEATATQWYDSQVPPTPAADRERMNGNRENGIRALLKYKARPLNGIWATPPYLHNGSVPNLYALLSPVPERPAKFYLGGREYDPVNVGYDYGKIAGGFEFDTSINGNRNTGHEFSNDKSRPGVLNRELTPDERRALVEYLKTL